MTHRKFRILNDENGTLQFMQYTKKLYIRQNIGIYNFISLLYFYA